MKKTGDTPSATLSLATMYVHLLVTYKILLVKL